VTVGPRDALLHERVRLRDVHWSRTPRDPREMLVQSRAHGAPTMARLDGEELVFASPQPRVAPGQVVAFYDGDLCCGGGIVAD
jgi:tRNA U34 2-thiouridine synthase MnmA/TrmU